MSVVLNLKRKICCILLFLAISYLLGACSSEIHILPAAAEEKAEAAGAETVKTFDTVVQDTMPFEPAPPREEPVPYDGPVQHIFFHPLILYPEKAFDGDAMSKGYNDWFVTIPEFKKILDSVYKNNFVLIDVNKIYEITGTQGHTTVTRKQLLLPKGKKPLVLSIDDMNYYEYMIKNGNASRLVLDDKGRVGTYSVTPKGEEILAYDNDIVPILDAFVEEHKDFSFEGAKGLIALTGYEGVLGYRTNRLDSPDYETERSQALSVIKRLKETGWSFASHGYGHLDTGAISLERLKKDTARWKKEVEPLVGETKIYVYPFGSDVPYKDAKFKYLLGEGFRIFFGVGADGYTESKGDCVIADRRSIDGLSFKYHREKLMDLFDVQAVIDNVRPKEY